MQPSARSQPKPSSCGTTGDHINVVIAEYTDGLPECHRIGEPFCRRIHIDQQRRVGQQKAQRRFQECSRRLDPDAARGEEPANNLGYFETLGDPKRDPVITGAPDPTPPAQASIGAAGEARER